MNDERRQLATSKGVRRARRRVRVGLFTLAGLLAGRLGVVALITAAPLRALAADLPPECASAASTPTPLDRHAWVIANKAHFYAEPRYCPPAKTCPWVRKGYVVRDDEVEELSQVAGGKGRFGGELRFSCARFRGTVGWLSHEDLCLPMRPRANRAEQRVFTSDDYPGCPRARTVTGDKEFFSGTFASDGEPLETEYLGDAQVKFRLAPGDPDCASALAGVATIKGLVATDPAGTTLAFYDEGVTLKAGPQSACPRFEKEFFFDPGGEQLGTDSESGSGCNVDVTDMDKAGLIYKLKRAVRSDDRKTVAQLLAYPLTVGSAKKTFVLRRPADLVARYDEVFDSCVKTTVAIQRIGRLFCRDHGAMLGNGALWIDHDPPKIVGINNGVSCQLEPPPSK
jgi:hypothetical protein